VSIWGVIPAKDPVVAKSRLERALPPDRRQRFTMQSLSHTIEVVLASRAVTTCVVVSGAREPLELAARCGAMPLLENPGRWPEGVQPPGARVARAPGIGGDDRLNAAIGQAAMTVHAAGASALLVVAADLPLIDIQSLDQLIGSLGTGDGLALASDRHASGTNALFVRPVLAMPFAFGPNSFARHQKLARDRGLDVFTCSLPNLALDIDTIDDVQALVDAQRSVRSGARPGATATLRNQYLDQVMETVTGQWLSCEMAR